VFLLKGALLANGFSLVLLAVLLPTRALLLLRLAASPVVVQFLPPSLMSLPLLPPGLPFLLSWLKGLYQDRTFGTITSDASKIREDGL
jgi:hypothetical protein